MYDVFVDNRHIGFITNIYIFTFSDDSNGRLIEHIIYIEIH